jgi:hypothetical protein
VNTDNTSRVEPTPRRRRYVPAVGPRLKPVLFIVFGLFAVITVNAAYLVGVTILEAVTGRVYQNWFYMIMFLLHLILGAAVLAPVVAFGIGHMRNTHDRRNRRAVRVGYGLFVVALLLMGSGVLLTRLEGIIEVKNPAIRSVAYWIHVISPLVAIWLFVLHRLAGKHVKWRVGLAWGLAAGVFAVAMLALQFQDPREWNVEGNPDGERYFYPSLARTVSGDFIPAETLQNDRYCETCHADIHRSWSASAHRFASFNNPIYRFSVRETREMSMQRDGNINRSRFCAGCHDPVPFFSGRFNDPDFDDINDPTAHAGVTCTVCHSISHLNTVRGNADFTIDAPVHYPFAGSDNRLLSWVSRQLVRAKPEFHKKTFLKPLHKTPEYCGACHKVHLPQELNDYKWLRGQNHYDTYLLSGVSGHGASSFYYPDQAETDCNGCHMPLFESDDFGAQYRDDSGLLKVHDHLFPSANTALPVLLEVEGADRVVQAHRDFNEGVVRVDLFGIKAGGEIDGELIAPLRPEVPVLEPGRDYLLETVIRTLKLGHPLTQGTVDSNEIWLDATVRSGGRIIGRSGGMAPDGTVDPWSHFVNAFVLDRDGNRIERRNVADVFVPLYDNQIPPGAADVVHYLLRVPVDVEDPITVDVELRYRKFDTALMQHIYGDEYVNRLPVLTLARDSVTFPVQGPEQAVIEQHSPIPEWQRWNDYGIGLLRKRGSGELRQAEQAFLQVEALGRPDGPLNLARVYIREGRVAHDAPAALRRAAAFDPPAPEWSVLWFSGLVNAQSARFDEAIRDFEQQARRAQRIELMQEARDRFVAALELDPENATAHYNLKLIYTELGEPRRAAEHGALHAKYKPDDNARDRAIAAARRRYPAANHAAEAVVLYDLRRAGAYELTERPAEVARRVR